MTSPSQDTSTTILLRAILIVMAGIFLLTFMGVLVRILRETYPVTELAAFRNLFGMLPPALILFGSAAWHAGGRSLAMRQWWLAALRGLFVTFAQLCFYMALTRLEFATVSTLAFAGPMIVTALSVPVLGDRVGPWRWAAVTIGFAGVILVMQPGGDAFTYAALLPIGAAVGYSCSAVTVRLIDRDVPSPLVNIYSTFATLIGASVLMLILDDPVAVASWRDMGLIVIMGSSGGLGVLCLIIA